jgi:neutral ceramidase
MMRRIGSSVLFTFALAASAFGNPLMAGVAQADITPPPGLPMYGYFPRIENNQLSTGTLDPLYARVLVLAVGNERLALVTLDLGRTFGKPLLDQLQRDASKHDGISYVVITASHTHAGPNILDEYPPGQTPLWETAAIRKIETAIGEACQDLAPARMGVGYGSVNIGYNRRVVNPDGTVKMLWTNPTKVPTSPVDPTVAVLRIDRMNGSPLAILVNYACHPVIFGEDNFKYSADYPGVMVKIVQQAFGGKPLCMFLQGGDGDINPYYATTPVVDGAVQRRDWTGQQIGLEVIRVARRIQTKADSEGSLQFSEDVLPIRVRWNPQKFREGLLAALGPKIFEDHADLFAQHALDTLELPVTTFLIDKRIAFAGMPGEPFVDFQIDWRVRCPVRDSFFLGYTNGYFDYFPTILAASEGGYGAGDSETYVAVGAAGQMLRHALVRLYGMLGKWSELPEDLKGR